MTGGMAVRLKAVSRLAGGSGSLFLSSSLSSRTIWVLPGNSPHAPHLLWLPRGYCRWDWSSDKCQEAVESSEHMG